jgi:signal transduction histidine kinase
MAVAGLGEGTAARAARSPKPVVIAGIALAGGAAAATTIALTLTSDHVSSPGVQAALMSWITLAYVFAGLVAWSRRPASRLGLLMIAAGFGTFMASLSSANAAFPFTSGIAFDLLAAVLYLHVFLAFPTGRLQRRAERVVLAVAYFAAFGLQLVGMALGGFGPDNLLEVVSEPDAAYTLLRVQLGVLSACMLAGVGLLVLRRRASGRPLRRSLDLLVDSFALALVMLAVLYTSAALGLVSGQPAFEWLRRSTLFVIGLAPLAFLFVLLRARLARTAVGDLLVRLRANPPPAELREALAQALGDPSLELAYWLPEFESWADSEGRPVQLPDRDPKRAVTLVDRDGTAVAALVHDASLRDEPDLLDAVAAAAAIALENTRLNVELRARLEDLRGSRARIVEAGDAERRRLERNLHDGAQQRLVAVALQLRLLQRRVSDDPAAAEMASAVGEELIQSLDELRELARGLHPAVLEHGLAAALNALATRSPVPTTVAYEANGRLPEPVELAAYFVASEALTNVAKYAGASTATVRVWRHDGHAAIEIVDDGCGGADDAQGSGLRGLADRVEALDGSLRVLSPAGGGTVVTAEMPCGS